MSESKNSKNHYNEDMDLKEVLKTQGSVEAEVVKSYLESNGISVLLRGLVVQSVHAFTADGLGRIKVFVPAKDFETAKKLLEKR
jgi:hypothetical protein